MTVVQALPSRGDVFFDVRDDGRAMRVGWHVDEEVVALSTWRYGSCVASCHVDRNDVPALVSALVRGLAATPSPGWTDPIYVDFSGEVTPQQPLVERVWRSLQGSVRRVIPRGLPWRSSRR
jgi:hypothetical protein